MPSTRRSFLHTIAALACAPLRAASAVEDYFIFTRPPRLFLTPRRLRLLRRERERDSMRFAQFRRLVEGGAAMPEPGFAFALHAIVTEEHAWVDKAVAWARERGNDPRQLAIVLDWLQDKIAEPARAAILAKLAPRLGKGDLQEPPALVRDRLLAALALADHRPEQAVATIAWALGEWWEQRVNRVVKARRNPFARRDHYAVAEILHAVNDNLRIDLRENAKEYFKEFPVYHVAGHYPAPFPAGDGEYRVPVQERMGDPDLREAALSRAAGLALAAYDPNSLECQFLQGWLIQDRFLLNSPFGAPYEYLWANPYLPGLSYEHLPLTFYADLFEAMFLRSSWDEDALWVGVLGGEIQIMQNGELKVMPLSDLREPLSTGNALLVSAAAQRRWLIAESAPTKIFLIGLEPSRRYDIEVDDEELAEFRSDSRGVLTLPLRRSPVGLRLREAGGA